WYRDGDSTTSYGSMILHPCPRNSRRSPAGSSGPMLAASSKERRAIRGSSRYLRYAVRLDTLSTRLCHQSSSHVHCVIELNGASGPGSGAAHHIGRYTNGSK